MNNPSLSRRTKSQIFSWSSKQNSSKCCTISKLHFASCLFMYNCSFLLHEHKQNLHIAYLTSWH